MVSQKDLSSENRSYWTGRAPGYSEVNRQELSTQQRQKWSGCLREEIERRFPGIPMQDLRVLDVGTGPGFFAILLSQMGCSVTAVDMTPAMLDEARKNAGELADSIRFLEMDAQTLEFPDDSFDLVVSRNLTWDLPDPAKAYVEWARVLAPGGMMLIFDANWYAYLFDEKAREAYERDRINSAGSGIGDQNVGENFDVMEDIAKQLPLSGVHRPQWDIAQLVSCGLTAEADENVWQRVWSDEEKINFASTPLFLVRAYR
ncbi:MAG: class I SAM-dependent methyltransferase [Oscillospiraceae bacterium]|nr:class I SAM-dependent methyltransferase [Oscillospiraceae bacterium]